jgi:hypothetical protein
VWETIGRGVEEPPDGTAEGGGRARARAGAIVGAVFTAVILWFMLVASAATPGQHHQSVVSAQDAAQALRPLAGSATADLFAAGLITSAVVALRAVRAGRPRPGLLRSPGRVHRARARGEPGRDAVRPSPPQRAAPRSRGSRHLDGHLTAL